MIHFADPDIWRAALVALIAAAVFTPIVRAGARKVGMVAAPKKDRWHRRPTALLGGVAIYAAVVSVVIWRLDHSVYSRVILPASTLLFVVGLLDDVITLKPYQKLIAQIIAASFIVYSGLVLPWTSSGLFNSAVTVFWLVGITNAVNMLDNMDGLAAGVAAIAAIFLAMNFFAYGQFAEATVAVILCGALVGFLLYNSQPASIFMGDCGSMFIGFFLASSALLATSSGRTRSFLGVIAVPVLTLVIPIFDTTFVTLLRKLSGRSASQGGRDHTSHRLVALGLSERRAVWLLYALATLSGYLSVQVRNWDLHESVMAILAFIVILTLTGVYLGGVKVYPPDVDLSHRPFVSFLIDLSYKRRIFESLLDASLIVMAYYGAWTLRFGGLITTEYNFAIMIRTLPLVVAIKMAVFLFTGVYRGFWRYIGLHDVFGLIRSTAVATVAITIAMFFAFGQHTIPRGVLLLDLLLLFMAMTGARATFRVARALIPTPRDTKGRPVLIYGAGDAGELLLREIFNNGDLGYAPIGFIDDDPKKVGKVIHGLRVYDGDSLQSVCESLGVQEVLISTTRLAEGRRERIVTQCDSIGLPLRQMVIHLQTVNSWHADPLIEPSLPAVTEPLLHVRKHGSTQVVGDRTRTAS